MEEYKYIVWIGGVDDYYTNFKTAYKDYLYWKDQGYDELSMEYLKTENK